MRNIKQCPDCKGHGHQFQPSEGPFTYLTCHRCNGNGYVPRWYASLLTPKLRRAAELLTCFLGSLVVYYFLGWQETVLEQCAVALLLIMIDMAILRQAMEGK